jgi:TetR/AcrR family transcriptional regulator
LFLYVADRATQAYVASLPRAVDGDIFDWLREATANKLRFLREQPLVYWLSLRILREPQHPVYAKARAAQGDAQGRAALGLRALVPLERLRPGVSPDDVVQLIMWVAAGLEERFIRAAVESVDDPLDAPYQAILADFDRYIAILKAGVFRPEVRA